MRIVPPLWQVFAPRNAGCPISGDTVTTASWTSVLPDAGAVQVDGSTRLDILPELGLDEDYTGYVQADADGLKLGADLLDAGGTRKSGVTYDGNILNLSDAGVAGNEGGVAFARIDYASFTRNTVVSSTERFYAGILDGTDVGAPLNSAEQSGTWKGQIALYAGGELNSAVGFDLIVVFDGDGGTLDATASVGLFSTSFVIDGDFTSAGIIYGTTRFGDESFSSTGSLTGLIGAEGAVGAFVSSGAGNRVSAGEARNRQGEYAGGFVAKASVPAVAVDCTTATGTPFAMGCDGELGIADVRTQLCLNDRTVADGSDNPTICGGLTMSFCFDTGANFGENPFDGRCDTETGIIDTRLTVCGTDGSHPNCILLLANNCPPTGTRHESCPVVADSASWKRERRNSDDTDSLTGVIASGAVPADNANGANFIEIGTGGLFLGSNVTDQTSEGGLTLSDLDGIRDDTSGFAIARGVPTGKSHQSFVGLSPTTNLGAPLSNAGQNATWAAKLHILVGSNPNTAPSATFKLKVDFTAESIQMVDDSDEETVVTFDNTALQNVNGVRRLPLL